MTGPNPVGRGELGEKTHAGTDWAGLPLRVRVCSANLRDDQALKPVLRAVPRIR
ncbi:hypothetical protein [Saccharothrix yanglingensis]|uniref:hypothetical protein n=1 Tax=Saccharothrix yanglingensis TaxID=659496 RepID=UPI0027D33F89|nr:hypothetical protein [Saccharothrix yanglingensis]